ncbi:MAG: hypothetical protein H0T71_02350 [Acidobacteria bacterium]|nr:hypothetical protein [Acidobacteriota bacterium]
MTHDVIRLVLAFAITLLSAPGYAQSVSVAAGLEYRPLNTPNPTLQASLDRIAKRSALWRSAVEAIRVTGRQVVIVTSEQVRVVESPGGEVKDAFDRGVLAEVAPAPHAGGEVDVVVAVVNLALLEEVHRQRGSLPSEFHADVDRILVHEIYGHAVPYLLAGALSGRCSDPQPGERAVDACSIRRENAVRAELGLGRRTNYGLDGLALMRGSHR